MVCAPGLAHQRLTPENCNELLFDDVIWLQQARRDHFDFVAKMVDRGVEVLELQDLLAEVVAIPEARHWLLDRKVTDDLVGSGLTHEIRAWLSELSAERLAEFLIGGVAYQDVPDEAAGRFLPAFGELDPRDSWFRPLPNTQFMRDNSAWIFHGVTLNPMYWPARRQSTAHDGRLQFDPSFPDGEFDVWLGDAEATRVTPDCGTLEGGDVTPIGQGMVVIGMGERTSQQAITQLARSLSAADAAERSSSQPCRRPARQCTSTPCSPSATTTSSPRTRPIVDGIGPLHPARRRRVLSGLELRREAKGSSPTIGEAVGVDLRVVATGGAATGSSGSSGTTATTWWQSNRGRHRLRPQHPHQHRYGRPASSHHHHRERARPWSRRRTLHDLPDPASPARP